MHRNQAFQSSLSNKQGIATNHFNHNAHLQATDGNPAQCLHPSDATNLLSFLGSLVLLRGRPLPQLLLTTLKHLLELVLRLLELELDRKMFQMQLLLRVVHGVVAESGG